MEDKQPVHSVGQVIQPGVQPADMSPQPYVNTATGSVIGGGITPPAVVPQQPVISSPQAPGTSQQPSPVVGGMFRRRIGRGGYFVGPFYTAIPLYAVIPLFIILQGSRGTGKMSLGSPAFVVVALLEFVLIIIQLPFYVSFTMRRLHDLDRTGWLSLLVLVPFLNVAIAIWLLFAKGTQGPNKYGPQTNSLRYFDVLGFTRPNH